MNILVTGAGGFVGKNLTENLRNIRDGKNRTAGLCIDEIYTFDRDTDPALLPVFCRKADFVFNLAGVNRPEHEEEFMEGNRDFAGKLLDTLQEAGNTCPVMLSSSVQASLSGRYAGSAYGRSKLAAEELFFHYAEKTGVKVYVYRFPNLFGKWCRPGYNSAVATFCYNIARDLPIQVNDRSTQLELLYIDDLTEEMLRILKGGGSRCRYQEAACIPDPDGPYYYVPVTYSVTLGEIVDLLEQFRKVPENLLIPEIPEGSFARKLYAAYLSSLPPSKIRFPLKTHADERGSFTEILRTVSGGQFSVNVSRPGVTKGQHWHNSKWEFFIVVSGHGRIQERKIGSDEVLEFNVSGENIQAVHMLPGYTHNIINLSETENLVTVMWANEPFDPQKPDTFREDV